MRDPRELQKTDREELIEHIKKIPKFEVHIHYMRELAEHNTIAHKWFHNLEPDIVDEPVATDFIKIRSGRVSVMVEQYSKHYGTVDFTPYDDYNAPGLLEMLSALTTLHALRKDWNAVSEQ